MDTKMCDLCKIKPATQPLRKRFEIRGVSKLCNECSSMANEYLWKQRDLFWKLEAKFLKRFLRRLKKAAKR